MLQGIRGLKAHLNFMFIVMILVGSSRDKFDDLEDCYAEKFAVPNLHDCKVFELKEDGSKELVYLYID